ncbi:MAG: trigger factor [Candidatus Nomurabacteria bacterium]|nr:MAG: trigger factor [Candidatus Nomurabacteria bacterium]
MQSKIVSNEEGTVTLQVTVPALALPPYLEKASQRISQKVKVEGFRVGKAPYAVLRQRLGDGAILEEAAEEIVQETFTQAVNEHKLITVGPPEVNIEKLAPDNDVIYTAKVGLLPKVTKVEYGTLKARPEKLEVKPEEVEKTIERLREMRAKESAVDRPAAKGDRVVINYKIFMDKVPVDNGQSQNFPVKLGESTLIPGFEDNLVGMKANEEKEFTLTFPKDSSEKRFAGKTVEVQAKVNQVFQIELPELNDEFAKSLGAFAHMDDVKKKIEENLHEEKKREIEHEFEVALMEELIEKASFDPIPEILRGVELNRIIREMKTDIEGRGLKWEDYLQHIKQSEEELRKEMAPQAEKRIKSALLLRHIADVENLAISDEELQKELEEHVQQASAQGILKQELATPEYKDSLKNHLRNQKVFALLKERASDKSEGEQGK